MLAILLLAAAQAAGQQRPPAASALPAAQPTSSVPSSAPAAQPAATVVNPTKLEVQFDSGRLTVDAANASLNQVLREIARKTGIKISGAVGEESVFGQYGPASTGDVLTALLDGTASNMLLVENQKGPQELILTPRRGGPSPPNPNAAMASNSQSEQPEREQQYVPPIRPFQPPTSTGRGPVGVNPDGSPASGSPPPEGGDGSSGSAPKTPQQIYDQLQSISSHPPAEPQN